MFEKRPIWGLVVGLNVCMLIWLISVQEPVMFDANTAALSSGTSSNNNYVATAAYITEAASQAPLVAALQPKQLSNDWRRDSLSKHTSAQSNEHADDMSLGASTLTTINVNNEHNKPKNDSKDGNTSSRTSRQTKLLRTSVVKTTAKVGDWMSPLSVTWGTAEALNLNTKPTHTWSTLTAVAPALPEEDFNKLIDLQHFRFLMHQPVCGNHIDALILIHSAAKNHEKRKVIRETWASIARHSESPLRVIFLLGAVHSEQVQNDLQHENSIHGDIVQGSFTDAYRNMTYKHIMAFKWFLYNCPQAQILVKVDDDVYVNTPQLIKYLKEEQQSTRNEMNNTDDDNPTIATTVTLNKPTTTTSSGSSSSSSATTKYSSFQKLSIFDLWAPSASATSFNESDELFHHPQNLLFCQKLIGSLVKRSYRSKWRVSFREYSGRYYPPYCPGYAIIYSPDVVYRLYTAAQNSKYFWIDDVHITGILAQQTNTTITTSSHYILRSDECDNILTGKTDISKTEFLFTWDSVSAQQIKLLWHLQMTASANTVETR